LSESTVADRNTCVLKESRPHDENVEPIGPGQESKYRFVLA
jgi:hypothetical protein